MSLIWVTEMTASGSIGLGRGAVGTGVPMTRETEMTDVLGVYYRMLFSSWSDI